MVILFMRDDIKLSKASIQDEDDITRRAIIENNNEEESTTSSSESDIDNSKPLENMEEDDVRPMMYSELLSSYNS